MWRVANGLDNTALDQWFPTGEPWVDAMGAAKFWISLQFASPSQIIQSLLFGLP